MTPGSEPAPMRFGVIVPNLGEFGDISRVVDLGVEAEVAGWDGFFIWDHVLHSAAKRLVTDPWIALAAIAARTTRVRIGPLVTAVPRRRPWKLARETVSLDHLSGGRVILGVGIGFPASREFEQFGEPGDARIRAEKLDEGLDVLAGLWSGRRFAHDGRHYQVRETVFWPAPVQQPRIPVWVGGRWGKSRAPFRRAARWDGVCPLAGMSLAQQRAMMAFIAEHRASAAPFDAIRFAPIPAGSPDEIAREIATWAAAGVTWWIDGTLPRPGAFKAFRGIVRAGPPERALRGAAR